MADEFDIQDVDGLTLYGTASNGGLWFNRTTGLLEAYDDAHWNTAGYVIPLTKTVLSVGVSAEYKGDMPPNAPVLSTPYALSIYAQVGGSPAASDGPNQWQTDLDWKGPAPNVSPDNVNDLITLARAQRSPMLANVDENLLQVLISSCSQELQNWMNRWIIIQQRTELFDGDNHRDLLLNNQPIVSVDAVTMTDIFGTLFTTPLTDIIVDTVVGDLHIIQNFTGEFSRWIKGHQNISVTYTSGLATNQNNVPYVIQEACVEMVILANATNNLDPLATSEHLGAYSVSSKQVWDLIGQLPANVQRQLGRYRRMLA